jgi:hypothetical protein
MSSKFDNTITFVIVIVTFIAGVWIGSRNNPLEVHYIPVPQKSECKILS